KWRLPSTVIEPVNGLWVGEVCKNSGRRLGDDMVAVVCHDGVFRFPATNRKEPWSPAATNLRGGCRISTRSSRLVTAARRNSPPQFGGVFGPRTGRIGTRAHVVAPWQQALPGEGLAATLVLPFWDRKAVNAGEKGERIFGWVLCAVSNR